ncbi:CBS domain-containing protein [Leptospira idonii]|uniref:CBS domain-containing protein n=1 Tax=Leptospira idonii TaxID=1193500 RepID=UPI001FE649B6|nr:CBS domain-containing protein [Leptospira idonii]
MKIESIYKHFLLTKATHLPVVGESGSLLGLISKERVLRELADLGKERAEYEQIPSEILETDLNENIIGFFKESTRIPVLDSFGERKEFWDKPRFLAEFSKLDASLARDPKLEEIAAKQEKKRDSQDSIHWYMELILANFPDGLLSTDVAGETIFYNEAFEKKFLPLPFFKDSVQVAERYLRDLNRELFANYLKENDLEMESKDHSTHQLQSIVKELDAFIRIVTLKKDKKVVGFLYHFSSLSSKLENVSKQGNVFPSLEEAFASRYPLERVLEEMESRYIYETLKRNKNNISHTASDLEIPRTTLQNRIKYLKIQERFKESESEKKKVIPRKRGIVPKIEVRAPQKPASKPKKVSKKSGSVRQKIAVKGKTAAKKGKVVKKAKKRR